MARPSPVIKPVQPYKYSLVKPDPHQPHIPACEDPDNSNEGYHLAEVKTWPPPRTRSGEPIASMAARCVYCGVNNAELRADNDPEVSNWKVKVLEKGGDLHAAQERKGRV